MSNLIDAHTHILPGMDDGSKDVGMSLDMLRMLEQQKVSAVIATPHFYASRENPAVFLERRKQAAEELTAALSAGKENLPGLLLGAEVQWYPGMGRTEELDQLCIGNTSLLLLEMPFMEWNRSILNEVRDIRNRGINPILAHVDRYVCFRRKSELIELNEAGLYLQVNADAVGSFRGLNRVSWMMDNRLVHFLGSDCHNMDGRKPNMDTAAKKLLRKCGEQLWDDFLITGESLIG